MEFKRVVEGRRSIRRFLPEPVPREDILEMLELATWAANASNKQMWRFYVVTNRDKIAAMRDAVDSELKRLQVSAGKRPQTDFYSVLFEGAPVTIAVAYSAYRSSMEELMERAGLTRDEIASRRQRPDIQSIGAAIQLLLCAAYEKGYGTCWMSAPMVARRDLESIIGVREGETLCALVALGRPAEAATGSSRKPVEQVTTFVE
ncbi:MAG: nitroreductase family protein [Firmicutes bacterium]|jgi:nitroreductase|nr:nitroreductase family protein [Bacillota bacterium]